MGALSFGYTVFPKPKISTKFFEYSWSTPLSEYRFKYERYAALSDLSIFKAPVAVTKVATGVRLYDLFVEKNEKDAAYFQSTKLVKSPHLSTYSNNTVPFYKVKDSTPWTQESLQELGFNHATYTPNIFERVDTHYDYEGYFKDWIPILPPHWNITALEFTMERIPYEPGDMKRYPWQEVINRPLPYMKVSLTDRQVIERINDSHMKIYKDSMFTHRVREPIDTNINFIYRVERINDDRFVIHRDESAIRINDDILNLFNDADGLFAWVYDYRDISMYDSFQAERDTYEFVFDDFTNVWRENPSLPQPDENFSSLTPPGRDMNIMSLETQITPDGEEVPLDFRFTNVSPSGRSTSSIEQINTYRTKAIGFVFEDVLLDRVFYKTSWLKQVYGGTKGFDGRYGLIYDPVNYLGKPDDKRLYFRTIELSGFKSNNGIQLVDIDGTSKTKSSSGGFVLDGVSGLKDDKLAFSTLGYQVISQGEQVCELSLADFSIKEHKYAFALDGYFALSVGKDLTESHNVWLNSRGKDTGAANQPDTFDKRYKDVGEEGNLKISADKRQVGIYTLRLEENFDKKHHFASDYELHGLKSKKRDLASLPPLITVKKNGSEVQVAYINLLGYNKPKHVFTKSDITVRIANGGKGFSIYNHIVPIDKEKYSFIIWPDQNPITKIRHPFRIDDSSGTVEKSRHPFRIDDSGDLIRKVRHGMSVYECDTSIYKQKKGINLDLAALWFAHKVRHSMVIPDWGGNIYKSRKSFSPDMGGEIIHKKRHPMSVTPDIENTIRVAYEAAVSHYLKYPNWEQLGGFIVPISRVRHQATIDDINNFIRKRYRDAMVQEDDFATVLSRPTGLSFDVSIDKLPRPTFLDYINEMLVKTRFKGMIEDGTFGFKRPHITDMQYEEPWGYMSPKSVQIGSGVFGGKEPKRLMIEDGGFLYKSPLQAEVFNDEWLDKVPLLCYYSYDVWGAKRESKVFLTPQELAAQNIKEVDIDSGFMMSSEDKKAMLQFGNFAGKNVNEAWYEYGVFTDRLIKDSAIAKQLEGAFKAARKCDLHPNDFGNWAWVYETPDPFQYDKYGIDELLLPEKDTQYEHFEDLIFDKEHMRPRDAIKEISDTQWIARLPIRHPVGKWQDVGKVYEDSAYKWENYFGIRTSVIHDMFLKYYRIWEKNMFKFSTMTMQQAGNLMLEYLWSWIPDYYPLDQIEEAYRTFRLIRWYTECAIINNSQYIISYEYADLKWPDAEHTGICHIPSDLQEYDPTNLIENSNDTMYSDTTPGSLCLRNNPIYTKSNDVWVTFKIKNKRNTTITLMLYNQKGSVNIYLNDILIDTVYAHGTQKLAYPIRYTGDVNEFKIEKKARDNLDNNFYIGHISITLQAFKDLKIDFDPALRAGNKPLNEVAQKLLEFAALHDRKDIAYHEMLTKNLGVSEVYKLLEKYWQLHHENKWKGKRLTIKQV